MNAVNERTHPDWAIWSSEGVLANGVGVKVL